MTKKVFLVRNNTRPRLARLTFELLRKFGFSSFALFALLVSSGFHTFPRLKNSLCGKRFDDESKLQNWVKNWMRQQSTQWYEQSLKKSPTTQTDLVKK